MSQNIRCPECGETENVECIPKPHHHVCHACGYDPYHGVPSRRGAIAGLPPFPVSDDVLDAVEHALGAVIDESGTLTGAEFSLHDLLDFYAGVDPANVTLVDATGLFGLPVYESHDVHYHAHDVIRALIGEVRRLRDESPYDDRSI